MGRLDGKVAVITGGANGIGRDTAMRFLAEGARVLIADVNAINAEKVLDEAAAAGHRDAISFARTNVAEETAVEAMFRAALDRFGRLDCIFNNAGIGGVFGRITETRVEDWDYTIAVLLRGVFLGMKHGARVLQAQGQGGSIISTASVAAFAGGAGAHCYSASKAAIVNLTRSVAVELAPYRIRVNAVAPGPVLTDLFIHGKRDFAERTIRERHPSPAGGGGRAGAGVGLARGAAPPTLVTGETVLVDGGMLASGPAVFGLGADNALFRAAGLDKGSTGEAAEVRRLGPRG